MAHKGQKNPRQYCYMRNQLILSPFTKIFIKCFFFWVFHLFSTPIEFLDLFLLIYIAWVFMLLNTLIKENE